MATTYGVIIPAITVFGDDGEIDFTATLDHLDWVIEGGVHAVLISGTCGEFGTLDSQERRMLIQRSVEHVAGRIPTFVGVMHTSTQEACELARHAEAVGASAVLSVPPYYSGPPLREIKTYFRDIAESVDIPFIVYNNPGAAGIGVDVPDLAELAREGTAAMIKESHGDPARLHDLRMLCPEETSLFYGEDYGSFEAMLVGADGWFAGIGNIIPRHSVKLWELCQAGDLPAARELWYRLLPLVDMTSIKPMFGRPDERPDFTQIFKAGLELLGRRAGQCRKPLLPLTDDDMTYLETLINELEITDATA
ncbi:MAG: dihydrodipicolinate synthase family protein [Nocardioidaceae bacterium]